MAKKSAWRRQREDDPKAPKPEPLVKIEFLTPKPVADQIWSLHERMKKSYETRNHFMNGLVALGLMQVIEAQALALRKQEEERQQQAANAAMDEQEKLVVIPSEDDLPRYVGKR